METIDTLEQLITEIFEAYEELYHDAELAAIATEVTLNDLFYVAKTGDRRQLAAA
jgi:hypothetical protein